MHLTLEFSRRARRECLSKCHRSCARSGRLERDVRRSDRRRLGCVPHALSTPSQNHAGTIGVRSLPRSCGITPSTTGVNRNHAQHTIQLPTTGAQHNEPPYHASITCAQHNEPSYHTLHHELLHDGRRHNVPSGSPIRCYLIMKGMLPALPRVPNGLPFSSRKRATTSVSKSERSRARSGRLERRVGQAGA